MLKISLKNKVSMNRQSDIVQFSLFPEEEANGNLEPEVKYDFTPLFDRLAKSDFRSRFRLSPKDIQYIKTKGLDTIRQHATEFIDRRLAPASIANDGKQTPMRGHPVFIAQHATGCCCRGCLYKWHHIPAGRELTKIEKQYIVGVLMAWIGKQLNTNIPPLTIKKNDI